MITRGTRRRGVAWILLLAFAFMVGAQTALHRHASVGGEVCVGCQSHSHSGHVRPDAGGMSPCLACQLLSVSFAAGEETCAPTPYLYTRAQERLALAAVCLGQTYVRPLRGPPSF